MSIDTLISIGYYVSSIGFLVAAIKTYKAYSKAGASGMKTVLKYIFIGTGTFFIITIFQKLGSDFFGIADESMDVWWHIMFYMAMISFYLAFKTLAGLGSSDANASVAHPNAGKVWGVISIVLLVVIFVIPSWAEPTVQAYLASRLAELGAHHFLAFALAGVVGAYVFSAKIFLGQIGRAISGPMIIAIWALALQHMWELLTESWAVIELTSDKIEGVEKIFLTISAISIIYSVSRLKAFSQS